jgi:hypothetical protein
MRTDVRQARRLSIGHMSQAATPINPKTAAQAPA